MVKVYEETTTSEDDEISNFSRSSVESIPEKVIKGLNGLLFFLGNPQET